MFTILISNSQSQRPTQRPAAACVDCFSSYSASIKPNQPINQQKKKKKNQTSQKCMCTHTRIYSSSLHRSKKTEKVSLGLMKNFRKFTIIYALSKGNHQHLTWAFLRTSQITLGYRIMQFSMYISSAPSPVAPGISNGQKIVLDWRNSTRQKTTLIFQILQRIF